MAYIRLGDLIPPHDRNRKGPFRTTEAVAQAIFDPAPDLTKVGDYYIQSQPILPPPAFMDEFPADTPQLGATEVLMVEKLLDPKRPVVVFIGPMGCGKTTTKQFAAIHLVKNRKHCERCAPPRNRLIAEIDFNEYLFLNELKGKELSRRVYSILCDQLLAQIKRHNLVDEMIEFHDFWKHELSSPTSLPFSSMAFARIVSEAKDRTIYTFDRVDDNILGQRSRLLKQIKKDRETFLDYLIRFWNYLQQVGFCGNRGCALIILDNLDPIHPNIQRMIVQTICAHIQFNGPTFLILVRPETFDQAGLGTNITDREAHHGPTPGTVIQTRLREFCNAPEHYYSPKGGLVPFQFEIVKKYLQNIMQIIETDRHQTFSDFITRTCGKSIRAGLVLSQGLLYADQFEMENQDISPRELVRLCIRQGETQVKWNANSLIEHLFRISTRETACILVKPRILQFLGLSKDPNDKSDRHERRKIAEILNTLTGFGYKPDPIYEAIADLMNINHQLIRANGFNALDPDALRNNGGLNVLLTGIGKSYLNNLMMDIDYVQEIMLDTHVNSERFPKEVAYDYLLDKFRLLFLFLQELRRVDRTETETFLERWPRSSYKDAFGPHLLSLKIIQGIYPAFTGILRSVANFDYKHEDLILDYESLVYLVENDNEDLLKTPIKSVVSERKA